jgi:hypothetical protein
MAFVASQDSSAVEPLIWISESGTDKHLMDALAQVVAHGAKSLMILACSANNHSAKKLKIALQSLAVPVCGGIFPSVFFADKKLDIGFILIGFPFSISVDCYPLGSPLGVDVIPPAIMDSVEVKHSVDLLIFIDAMASSLESFIGALYETVGGGIDVIGGGAGSIDFVQRPCIFSRFGLLMDTALVVQLPVSMCCAVAHGWEVLSGPYLVTESENVNIKTLNYLPAFDVYKGMIEEITTYRFSGNNFFQISQNFPLGILGINDDILVRDPIQVSDNELLCVGTVPVNSMVYILSGKAENIIAAAESVGNIVARQSEVEQQGANGLSLVFDCVSRVLYLGDKFPLEMAAIQRGVGDGRTLVGALSIGEIANTSSGTINLLNKSIVIGNL